MWRDASHQSVEALLQCRTATLAFGLVELAKRDPGSGKLDQLGEPVGKVGQFRSPQTFPRLSKTVSFCQESAYLPMN